MSIRYGTILTTAHFTHRELLPKYSVHLVGILPSSLVMDNPKNSKEGRRGKRRMRSVTRGSSAVTAQSSSDSATTSSISSAISARLARRETRKLRRKGDSTLTQELERGICSTNPPEESLIAEDSETEEQDLEEELTDSVSESYYSVPGAYRVKRKFVNSTQIDFAMEEGSIESFSTAKTPPVIIPSASLVQDHYQEDVDEGLPVAIPETSVLFVTRRHIYICVVLGCLLFGGLLTGLLFALWDRAVVSETSHNAVTFSPVTSGTPRPSLDSNDSISSAFVPSTAPSKPTSPVEPTVASSLTGDTELTIQPTSYPEIYEETFTKSPTPIPTKSPSPSPTRMTSIPTIGYFATNAPTRGVNGEFSLTNRPTPSPIAPTMNPNQETRS